MDILCTRHDPHPTASAAATLLCRPVQARLAAGPSAIDTTPALATVDDDLEDMPILDDEEDDVGPAVDDEEEDVDEEEEDEADLLDSDPSGLSDLFDDPDEVDDDDL